MSELLSIGEVAAAAGISRDAIRYYERLGLLPKPLRTAAGYRQYRAGVVTRLALVCNAHRFGFSLREISGFLRVRDDGGKPCHDVRAAAQRMLEGVDQQIAELLLTRKRMRVTLRMWDRTLASTAAGRPAHLLEALNGQGRARTRPLAARASAGKTSPSRP